MTTSGIDHLYTGSLPTVYQTYLVPLIFEPYAADLAQRLTSRPVRTVLEVAAGTGALTRALDSALPPEVSLIASDLNQPMLDQAAAIGTKRPVQWRQADAMRLPFDTESFDAVVCQFGAMFPPDKSKAFSEVRRVLRPGGVFFFSVWDRIEDNEFADDVTKGIEPLFPEDPPRFLARTPHGYCDPETIRRDLAAGGFQQQADIATVTKRSRADSPKVPAVGFIQGTPVRNEIEARNPALMSAAIDAATNAVARRFGTGAVDGKIQALVVRVER